MYCFVSVKTLEFERLGGGCFFEVKPLRLAGFGRAGARSVGVESPRTHFSKRFLEFFGVGVSKDG
jgi:hypothetical protein